MKPKKLLKVPLKALDFWVERQTGGLIDLSEIFSTVKEAGGALDAELVVSMPDGSSAEILWDPAGSVSSSQVIAVVESILSARPSVTSISVLCPSEESNSPTTSKQQLALPFEGPTESTSGGVVSIQYSEAKNELPV